MADAQGHSLIDAAFPPGTQENGERRRASGLPGKLFRRPHQPGGCSPPFSIVLDDGQGSYRNELEISNTLDPSPYFNLPLNARSTGIKFRYVQRNEPGGSLRQNDRSKSLNGV